MKKRYKLLFRFLIFSFVFFIIWIRLGEMYLFLIAYTSNYLLQLMGYNITLAADGIPYFIYRGIRIGMEGSQLGNFNIVPFLALILATPDINPVKRIKMILMGMPVLFSLHVIDFISRFPMYFHQSEAARIIYVSVALGEIAVPFLLWFALSYKDILAQENKIKKHMIKRTCPICGIKKINIEAHIKAVHEDKKRDV